MFRNIPEKKECIREHHSTTYNVELIIPEYSGIIWIVQCATYIISFLFHAPVYLGASVYE